MEFALSDAAMRARPGPMRTPRPGCASVTKSSAGKRSHDALDRRARETNLPGDLAEAEPFGFALERAQHAAARAMTCTPRPASFAPLHPSGPHAPRESPDVAWLHQA